LPRVIRREDRWPGLTQPEPAIDPSIPNVLRRQPSEGRIGCMKKRLWMVLFAAPLVGLAGFVVVSRISTHRFNAEQDRKEHEAEIGLHRLCGEEEELGREYDRKVLKLFEGRNFRKRADGRPSEMVAALAAISEPSAPVEAGSDLEHWLRWRFKRPGRFSPREVLQVAEEEVARKMPDPSGVDSCFLGGIVDQGITDLGEAGEEGLIAGFEQELERLYGEYQFSEALRFLEEEKGWTGERHLP
jgi:hypothetical protein